MNVPAALIASIVALSTAYAAGRIHGGDKVRGAWDKDRAERTAAALHAEQQARLVEAQRLKLSQEVQDDARKKVARARADAASAAAAADGLRDAARAAAGRCAAVDSTPTGRGTAGSLADVLAEVERAGRGMAEAADAAVIAGQACEAAYGALVR